MKIKTPLESRRGITVGNCNTNAKEKKIQSQHSYMIGNILDRLDKVKPAGPNSWLACCPSHSDNTPSLSVSDTGDKVLTHCYAGCSFFDIADAIGLPHSAFFESRTHAEIEYKKQPRLPYKDALTVVRQDMWVLLIAAQALKKGPLNDVDSDRLIEAGKRIEAAWRATHE